MRRSLFPAAVVIAALLLPSTAAAQDSVLSQAYAGQEAVANQVIDEPVVAGEQETGQGAVPAGAQGPSGGPAGGDGAPAGVPTAAPAPQEASAGELPFTGLDVAWVLLAGAALLGTGVAVRRLAHPSA